MKTLLKDVLEVERRGARSRMKTIDLRARSLREEIRDLVAEKEHLLELVRQINIELGDS